MGLLILLTLGLNCRSNSLVENEHSFLTSVEEASKLASEHRKNVFVHVGAEWCKPCRALHRDIYPQPLVEAAFRDLVKLELDMDSLGDEHVELIRAMNVQSIPMIAIFASDLKTIVKQPVVAKADAKWVLEYLENSSALTP